MCPSHRFFLSNTVFKRFLLSFTMPNIYSLILWSFQLMFSIFHKSKFQKPPICPSRTFLMSKFPIYQRDAPNDSLYNLLLQIFGHSFWKEFSSFVECVFGHCNSAPYHCCTCPIIWDEWSQKAKLVNLLYYLSIYCYVELSTRDTDFFSRTIYNITSFKYGF